MKKTLTHHWRGYVGTYVWSETEQQYVCEWSSRNGREHIFTYAPNRFVAMLDWIITVNCHLEEL